MKAPLLPDAEVATRRRTMREALLVTDRLHKALWLAVAEQVAHEEISVVKWLILSDIGSGRGGTLTDYARWLARDPGALSRTIHELIGRDLVRGVRISGDRRRVRLQLTAAGEALRFRISPQLDRLASALEEGFGGLPLDDLVRRMTRAEAGVRARPRGSLPIRGKPPADPPRRF